MQTMPFVGNLTDRPRLYQAGEGKVARFRLACNDRYRDRSGQWQNATAVFLNVEVWGAAADVAATWTKGTPIVGVGTWRASEYTDKDSGEQRRSQYLHAEAVGVDAGRAAGRAKAKPRAEAADEVPARVQAPPPDDGDPLWDAAK